MGSVPECFATYKLKSHQHSPLAATPRVLEAGGSVNSERRDKVGTNDMSSRSAPRVCS